MSKEQAREFLDKLYSDDDFAVEAIKKSDVDELLNGQGSGDAIEARQNALYTKMGSDMGFDFTEEEFQDATTDYVQDLGAMKALASGLRVNKLAKKIQKGKL